MQDRNLAHIVEQEFSRLLGSIGFENALAAPRQTAAQPAHSEFNLWQGWSPSVRLPDLINGSPPAIFTFAGVNVYRISFPDGSLSIGMTESRTIQARVTDHLRRAAGEQRVRDKIASFSTAEQNNIRVQAGRFRRTAQEPSIRTGHMYEIWLQLRERVFDWRYIRNTRTFE
jgi:hypothetical protein